MNGHELWMNTIQRLPNEISSLKLSLPAQNDIECIFTDTQKEWTLWQDIANQRRWILFGQYKTFSGFFAELCEFDWISVGMTPPPAWDPLILCGVASFLNSNLPIILFTGLDLTVTAMSQGALSYGSMFKNALGKKLKDSSIKSLGSSESKMQFLTDLKSSGYSEIVEIEFDDGEDGFRRFYHFVINYSAICASDGRKIAITARFNDLTLSVLRLRRLATLRKLGINLSSAKSTAEFWTNFEAAFKNNSRDDVFFHARYTIEDEKKAVCICPIESDQTFPEFVDLISAKHSGDTFYHSLASSYESKEILEILPENCSTLKNGCISIIPILDDNNEVVNIVILGTNKHLPFDEECHDFFDLIRLESEHNRLLALIELNKNKSAFFALISREIRQPLSLILGPLESALIAVDIPEKLKQGLQSAFQNAQKLLKMVENLSARQQLENTKFGPIFRPANVSEVTSNLSACFQQIVKTAGVTYIENIEPDIKGCYLDITIWEKIVMGSLSHALQLCSKGRISLKLYQDSELNSLILEIHGIPHRKDNSAITFESVFSFEEIKGHVQAHHGKLKIQRNLEIQLLVVVPLGGAHLPPDRILDIETEGETFTQMELVQPDSLTVFSPTFNGEIFFGSTMTKIQKNKDEESVIFVVSENEDLREHFSQVLGDYWITFTFENGAAALEAVKSSPPNLILADIMLDVWMPVLNGFQLLQHLKGDSSTKGIPVIILSTESGANVHVSSLQAGACDYLVKPFGNKELSARVKTHLDIARSEKNLKRRIAKQSEKFKFQQNMLNDIIEQNPAGIFLLTSKGIEFCNPKFASICGYDCCAKLIDDSLANRWSEYDVILPQYQDEMKENYMKSIKSKQEFVRVKDFEIKVGDKISWIECNAKLRYDEDGAHIGSVVTWIDVTSRKAFEERQLNNEKQRANDAEEYRKQQEIFIDMICHEIRNPLSGIANNNDFIRETLEALQNYCRFV
ncbi:hypothetical protein HK100_005206, partial [Physocladia obscura]